MEDLHANGDQRALFEVEGQLSEEDALFLEESTGIGSASRSVGEIATPLRARSFVSIGQPIVHDLTKLLAKRADPVPADMQLQTKHHEFYQVQLTCSFQAAAGCRFHDARFALRLETLPGNPSTPAQPSLGDAIAYDLYPQKIADEYKVSIKRAFNPQLTLTSDPSSPSISLPLYEGTEEYIVYKGYIEAFDLQGTQPAWSFTRTSSHEIGGPYKLFLVIRKPKGTQVKASFSLTTHVQFMIGKIALDPLPLVMIFRRSRNNPDIVDNPTVPLC
jgi:hypothetical protein